MRLGKLEIDSYEGIYGDRIFLARIINKFGGSSGYADPSFLKVFLWLININRI